MSKTPIGKRVKLIHTTDIHTKLTKGDEGVITDFDALGTMFVKWDSGSSLGLLKGEDSWEVLDDLWEIDNGCNHDWNFIDGNEGTMKCSECGHYQN